jgi:hypothetical protein
VYNLLAAVKEICPCCGRGGEATIAYCREHDKDQKTLYEEAIQLGGSCAGDLIGVLLSSDYNIFQPWYKAMLIWYKDNGDTGVTFEAADLLDYYKESFDKVEDL